jgi:hypothetical protein
MGEKVACNVTGGGSWRFGDFQVGSWKLELGSWISELGTRNLEVRMLNAERRTMNSEWSRAVRAASRRM